MAEIISELISLLRIKDITPAESKGTQGGGLSDWAKPGAEIEGVVLGAKGPLDIISINDEVIRAKADGHLPVGARVQFRVMDAGTPIKVRLLSVMAQSQGGRQFAMDSLAVKAGIPRISQMLPSLLDALSNYKAGDDQSGRLQGGPGDGDINAALQRASSLLEAFSYGGKASPEKVSAFFTLMTGAGNGPSKTSMPSLQTILKNVLDGLIDAKNLYASGRASVDTPRPSIEVAVEAARSDIRQGLTLPMQGMTRDVSAPEGQNTVLPLKTLLEQDALGHVVSDTAPEARLDVTMRPLPGLGQNKSVLANVSSGIHPSGPSAVTEPALARVAYELPTSALKQPISQDAAQSHPEAGLNARILSALTKKEIMAGVTAQPSSQAQREAAMKEAPVTASQEGTTRPRDFVGAGLDLPRPITASQEGTTRSAVGRQERDGGISQPEGRQESSLSQVFDAGSRGKLLENAVQGLKTLSSHLDAVQNYQCQVQARLDAPFFMAPFWFENAAGFGNFTYWTDGDGGNPWGSPESPVSHLIFDLELKGLGPMMMHVTLRKDSLNMMVAAGQDVLPEIRAGLSELKGITQGLGYRLEISGIVPIDEANQADFAGPLAGHLDSRSSFHLVT